MLIKKVYFNIFAVLISFFISGSIFAKTLPFTLSISGKHFNISKNFELSDPAKGKNKINFSYKSDTGKKYIFDLKFKKLPDNRSYPNNLDVTITDAESKKLGYLFWANNGVESLKEIGVFGIVIDIDGEPMDVRFVFDDNKTGDIFVKTLGNERLFSDTLIPKKGFQMIRPMLVPEVEKGRRSQSYELDAHPFEINYTLKNINKGQVQFQYNLFAKQDNQTHLLEKVYYNAKSLDTLRKGMFAGKYFDKEYGTFKLVFYPAMGQTKPPEKP